MPDNVAKVASLFTLFVLCPLALAIARLVWLRATKRSAPQAQLSGESAQRLERLEQGMEAIAIEIERVAEGQRFVTRILSESRSPERIGVSVDS